MPMHELDKTPPRHGSPNGRLGLAPGTVGDQPGRATTIVAFTLEYSKGMESKGTCVH
jgi:hypothetical protein